MKDWTKRTVLILLAVAGIFAFLAMSFCFFQFFVTGTITWLVAGMIFGVGAILDLIYYADLYRRNW